MDDASVAAPGADLETVLNRMADGVFALDTDWRITYANDRARSILRAAIDDAVLAGGETVEGLVLWEAIPEAVDTEFHDRYHEAMDAQAPVSFESYYEPLETHFDVRVFPSESGLSIHLRDVTERRELERQQAENLQVLQQLSAVSSDPDRSFDQQVEELLRLGREYLDVPNGFLTRIEGGTQRIEAGVGTHPRLQAGEACPLEEAYCKRTIDVDGTLTVTDPEAEGWADDPAYDRFGLGTYIGRRIEVEGELYGTVCFADTAVRGEPFPDAQRTFVELVTRWIAYELERERSSDRLERERDRLEKVVNVISHDLRNPLNTAAARTTLLAEETDSEHLEPIDRSLSRVESLIEDLLTFARHDVQIDPTGGLSLEALARDAWTTTGTADAALTTRVDGLLVSADESQLRRLLENLFRNAVEHAGDDVAVTIGALEDREGFFVADDGPGVPESERTRVFETGYTTSEGGTGFGLGIVAEIAAAHGWTVAVTDGADGGARFEVRGVETA